MASPADGSTTWHATRAFSFSICLDANTRGTDESTASGTVLAMGLSFHVRLSVNALRIFPCKSKMAVENGSQGQPDEGTRLFAAERHGLTRLLLLCLQSATQFPDIKVDSFTSCQK